MLKLLNFFGNPNVGVMAKAAESHVYVTGTLNRGDRSEVEEALGKPIVATTLGGTTLVGSLLAANSKGIVVADLATRVELKVLESTGLALYVMDHRLNAAGNNLLVNDHGGLCHPDLPDDVVRRIEDALGVPFQRGTLAGLGTVGMAAVATDQGVLVHPKATPEEQETARRALKRDVMVGTINRGTALIGAGLVANSKGAVIGSASTGIEINRVEDALGFLRQEQPA